MAGKEEDLHRVKGIGPTWTAALETIGVDSVKELRHRNADSLARMMKERKGGRGISVREMGPRMNLPADAAGEPLLIRYN